MTETYARALDDQQQRLDGWWVYLTYYHVSIVIVSNNMMYATAA